MLYPEFQLWNMEIALQMNSGYKASDATIKKNREIIRQLKAPPGRFEIVYTVKKRKHHADSNTRQEWLYGHCRLCALA